MKNDNSLNQENYNRKKNIGGIFKKKGDTASWQYLLVLLKQSQELHS